MNDETCTLFYSVNDFEGADNLMNVGDFDKKHGPYKDVFAALDKIQYEPSNEAVNNILDILNKTPNE
jgi:hypothetical protein